MIPVRPHPALVLVTVLGCSVGCGDSTGETRASGSTGEPGVTRSRPAVPVERPVSRGPEDPRLDIPGTGTAEGVAFTALADTAPMRFVALGGGEFTMGSPEWEEGHQPWEAPRHRVEVAPFLIAETEVTESQWSAVAAPDGSSGGAAVGGDVGQLPRGELMWCDAVRFANALSRVEGLREAYGETEDCAPGAGGEVTWDPAADGFRLPTEAEWEYAARAGSTTRFWRGDRDEDLWQIGFVDRNAGERRAVGTKLANPFGLYDVHGNVWEWVWDPFQLYTAGGTEVPLRVGDTPRRVARGGGYWHGSVRGARSASRNGMLEGSAGRDWCRDIGLRLALTRRPEDGP